MPIIGGTNPRLPHFSKIIHSEAYKESQVISVVPKLWQPDVGAANQGHS